MILGPKHAPIRQRDHHRIHLHLHRYWRLQSDFKPIPDIGFHHVRIDSDERAQCVPPRRLLDARKAQTHLGGLLQRLPFPSGLLCDTPPRCSVPRHVRATPLIAPLLPPFDPRSSPSYSYYSYFGVDTPIRPGTPTISKPQRCSPAATPSSPPFPSPPFFSKEMRPWLSNGLAGTPLASLSLTIGSAWAGY